MAATSRTPDRDSTRLLDRTLRKKLPEGHKRLGFAAKATRLELLDENPALAFEHPTWIFHGESAGLIENP